MNTLLPCSLREPGARIPVVLSFDFQFHKFLLDNLSIDISFSDSLTASVLNFIKFLIHQNIFEFFVCYHPAPC